MTESRRPFRADDIPLTKEGNAFMFHYPKLSDKMYKTNKADILLPKIMDIVYDTINKCEEQDIYDPHVMRVNIAYGLNKALYPLTAGIKEEIDLNKIKPMFPGTSYPNIEIKYINIDDLLEQTKEQKPKAGDIYHSPYPAELMNDYGFEFSEAREIGFKKNFTIDEVMEIVRKTAKQVKSKTKVKLIDEIINIFKS